MPRTRQVYNWLLNNLFPPTCLLCGDPGRDGLDLCPGCRADLPAVGPACRACSRPLPGSGEVLCGRCQRHPPRFDRCRTPLLYGPPVDYLVQRLKFGGQLTAARLLGGLLAAHLETLAERPERLVPVPLHPSRLRERGFNQALELARPLGAALGVPIETRRCRRVVATEQQSQLTGAARLGNVRGAFAVQWPAPPRSVAIVDDVLSTGATAGELAAALKRAGVERVEVWVAARAG